MKTKMKLIALHRWKNIFTFYFCIIFCTLIKSNSALKCFQCSSTQDSKCSKESPSGSSVIAANGDDLTKFIKVGILSLGLKDLGIDDNVFTESDILGIIEKSNRTDAEGLKDTTVCAYMYASMKSIGKKGGQNWVNRGGITLKIGDNKPYQQSLLNQCTLWKRGDDIFLVDIYLCVCTQEECNHGPEKNRIMKKIFDCDSSNSNSWKIDHHSFVTIYGVLFLLREVSWTNMLSAIATAI